tara:strand:- start:261 stop:383 length:123 start_codon:yes stop_codon:yes gene_type:complete
VVIALLLFKLVEVAVELLLPEEMQVRVELVAMVVLVHPQK